MKDPFTTQFKVVVAFILVIAAFALLGGNQLLLQKEVNQAVDTSNQAVSLSSHTVSVLKGLTTTPTATPSATPGVAVKARVFTPAVTSKPIAPAK